MKKISIISAASSVLMFGFALSAHAHVVVTPSQVGIGSYNTFTVGVPTEKDVPTIKVRLMVPAGLQEVVPNTKPGWYVRTVQTGTGDDANVTEIDWSGGIIPVGQRDEFSFSAQVPATTTELQWKAYQTYSDGSVVSWDATPTGDDDSVGNSGPYSVTKVIDDLTPVKTDTSGLAGSSSTALTFSIIALAISGIALITARKNQE